MITKATKLSDIALLVILISGCFAYWHVRAIFLVLAKSSPIHSFQPRSSCLGSGFEKYLFIVKCFQGTLLDSILSTVSLRFLNITLTTLMWIHDSDSHRWKFHSYLGRPIVWVAWLCDRTSTGEEGLFTGCKPGRRLDCEANRQSSNTFVDSRCTDFWSAPNRTSFPSSGRCRHRFRHLALCASYIWAEGANQTLVDITKRSGDFRWQFCGLYSRKIARCCIIW